MTAYTTFLTNLSEIFKDTFHTAAFFRKCSQVKVTQNKQIHKLLSLLKSRNTSKEYDIIVLGN